MPGTSDDEPVRTFSPLVIARLKEAAAEILSRYRGWGDIVIEFRRGEIRRVYLGQVALYVVGETEDK